LAGKTRLWALSNTNIAHSSFVNEHFAIPRHFEGQVLSREVGLQKPDERIFRLALERTGAKAPETVLVDDPMPNVERALAPGRFSASNIARNR
jgi:HAD superfamily hydrolase (TIGR01509 family)